MLKINIKKDTGARYWLYKWIFYIETVDYSINQNDEIKMEIKIDSTTR